MFDLTMYVPTKGRPHNAQRLQNQFYATRETNSRLLFILSDNDSQLDRYRQIDFIVPPVVVSPSVPGFVNPLNLGFKADSKKSYAVGFMGDDHLPQTQGWDLAFINTLNDMQTGFVYGNDKLQEHRIPTHIAMTSNIPNTLGFMTLPSLLHLYADNFWLDLGNAIDRIRYLSEVTIEHLHPGIGKANIDEGYKFSSDPLLDSRDAQIYFHYLQNEINLDIAKLLPLLENLQ